MTGRVAWSERGPSLVMAAAVAVLVTVTALIFVAYRRAAADLVIERDKQLAFLSAARLREELDKYAEVLESVARESGMASDNPRLQFGALRANSPRMDVFDGGVVLLDRMGTVRTAHPSRPEIIGQDWSSHQVFRAHLTSSAPTFSDVSGDGPDGATVVAISVPVRDGDGALLGALAGMFRLGDAEASPLYASIVRLRLGQSGNTYVIDGRRRILYDSAFRDIGRTLDEHGPVALPESATADAIRTRDGDGNDVIMAFAPVPGTKWVLVTEDDWQTLTGPMYRRSQALMLLFAVGLVAPVAALHAYSRHQRSAVRKRHDYEAGDSLHAAIEHHLGLQPVPVLPGWTFATHRPSSTKPDLADVLVLPDGRVLMALAEMPPGTLPSSVLSAMLRSAMRSAALAGLPPGSILAATNAALCPQLDRERPVPCVVAILDPTVGVVEVCSGGHDGAWRISSGRVDPFPPGGPSLGVAADAAFRAERCALPEGHGLVLMAPCLAAALLGDGGVDEARCLVTGPVDEASGARGIVSVLASAATDRSGADLAIVERSIVAACRWSSDANSAPAHAGLSG